MAAPVASSVEEDLAGAGIARGSNVGVQRVRSTAHAVGAKMGRKARSWGIREPASPRDPQESAAWRLS